MSKNTTNSKTDTEKTNWSEVADEDAKKGSRPTYIRKGGQGSRSKRTSDRAQRLNPARAAAITAQAEERLGIRFTEAVCILKPGSNVRPTAVNIDLAGCNSLAQDMLNHMNTVAQRPLAILLGVPINVDRYRKVVAYLLHCRVCAAQQKVSYMAGTPSPLVRLLTADRLRTIDTYMLNIPNFLAWMLTNIGVFDYESVPVVPTYPNPQEDNVTIRDAIRGNFESLCTYVQRHRQHHGAPIPVDDEALLPVLRRIYPIVTLGNAGARRFTAATSALFVNAISPEEWNAFKAINNALNEQRCTTHTFSLSEAVGTEVPRVRFNSHEESHTQVCYYATNAVDDAILRAAVVLRLGNDVMLPDDAQGTRFIGAYNRAVFVGHVTPATYVDAQLQMITKLEIR